MVAGWPDPPGWRKLSVAGVAVEVEHIESGQRVWVTAGLWALLVEGDEGVLRSFERMRETRGKRQVDRQRALRRV